ncbi:hypothetical protein SAMN05421643_105187 [Acinetobacter kyonggiensis]|uniref:Uncharacterized protein n=1 Tax=Acinetobacter kyonggiensis TaxID=595670 RepID=A0A1H3I419_9GAMM|nr:hypothetical protein SAMN05421643_105187 [Acinetobacter kyonggiensis]
MQYIELSQHKNPQQNVGFLFREMSENCSDSSS